MPCHDADMREIELKFQVPDARRAALGRALARGVATHRIRLEAAYFDTADRRLARAGLGLRLRREGDRWVQTLKGASLDGIARAEHNVPRGVGAMPSPDAALHAATPIGAVLQACLAGQGGATLVSLYGTAIERVTRPLTSRAPRGRVEMAFDVGRVEAGPRTLPVCELEIELLAGSPLAVLATARRWLPRFGLWLDSRSKAERGDLLARGEQRAPPRTAQPVALRRKMSVAEAWQNVLRSCADQIIANASQVASGDHADEHVHQLRVGLRRLRSAHRFFEGLAGAAAPDPQRAALAEPAAALFRALGEARDGAVFDAGFGALLGQARRASGLVESAAPAVALAPSASATDTVREPAHQMLLLDLIAAMQTAPEIAPEAAPAAAPATAPPRGPLTPEVQAPSLRSAVARRLNRWHARVVADAKRYADLDDAARHGLRKRAKRLRYAAEFSADLFERRAVRRYLSALRALQDRLGAVSDTTMAMARLSAGHASGARAHPAPAPDADTAFALGWLASRREWLVASAAPQLDAFVDAKRFWK